MSLLSVTVKKARFVGSQEEQRDCTGERKCFAWLNLACPRPDASQWNSYVTLKLQHVKSTTVQVKGPNPSWEQDFLFEINNLDAGLLIEVWASGRMWDNSVGYHWLHLKDIQHAKWVINGTGTWLSLDAELVMRDGQVVGTKTATGHALLIDARFELPYGTSEVEVDDAVDLQRKLEMYNSMLDEETRAEQARKQHQYYIQCESGVSEDSDYTSDVNYPVGQHPNSSASQFLSAANQLTTPQRSLTSSRENSYEKDDDFRSVGGTHDPYQPPPYSTGHRKQLPTVPPHPSNHRNHHGSPSTTATARTSLRNSSSNSGYWDDQGEMATEGDPLYYNSRPQSNYRSYSSTYRRGDSTASWDNGYTSSKPNAPLRQYSDGYDDAQDYSPSSRTSYPKRQKSNASSRRGTPSLERQYTRYHGHDDQYGDYYGQEPMEQDGQAKQQTPTVYPADSYSSSPYQQQNLYNAQKSSVYEEYSDQYGDYGSAGTICNDYSRTSVDGTTQQNDTSYVNDTSYGGYGWGQEESSLRDQYNRNSSKRSGKELPQLPVPQSQSQQVSPYASQSTVKEVSVSSINVPSIIATQYEDTLPVATTASAVIPISSMNDRSVPSSYYNDYSAYTNSSIAEESFYDAVSTAQPIIAPPTTSAPTSVAHSSIGHTGSIFGGLTSTLSSLSHGVTKAVVAVEKAVESSAATLQQKAEQSQQQLQQHQQQQQQQKQQQQQQLNQQHPQQIDQQQYESYDTQAGYEDWQNYGYYDESGNYIMYDQSGYYDDQQTITEETVGVVDITVTDISSIVSTAEQQLSESLQYSKEDQYDPYYTTTATTTTAPTVTATSLAAIIQTTEAIVHNENPTQEDTYGHYDNTEFYDAEGEMMQMDYGGYEGAAVTDEYGVSATTDEYGVRTTTDEYGVRATTDEYGASYGDESYGYMDSTYDQTSIEPSQKESDMTSKSNVEYNYAYQSAENLSNSAAYENGYSTSGLDRTNSISRRASFKRQTSTREGYGYPETMDTTVSVYSRSARNSLTPAAAAIASSLPITSTATAPSIAAPGSAAGVAAQTGAAAVGAAASAATKLTSEIKSALPQLTSLTKGKTGGLFSSGFSKFGSFVSNTAEKAGVPIPPVIKDAAAAAAAATGVGKQPEKTNVETAQQQNVVGNHVDMTLGKSSMQPGMYDEKRKDGYYNDQHQYDEEGWEGQTEMDRRRHPQSHGYNDAYDQYEGTEEGPESYASGPVHMDSLESNVSEGGRDAESTIEAQYWQKQRERIAKQNSMAAPDSENFYDQYDPYDKHKGVFQASVDSPHPQNGEHNRQFSKEDYEKQHSLDRDEWLNELDRQSGGRAGHLKRGDTEMSTSLDRGDSIDHRHLDEYGDEYITEDEDGVRRKQMDVYPMRKDDGELVDRKSSLETAPEAKEKGSKSVSFEEEPPKPMPQTKGMSPREKWLWAINRICAQLAVSTFIDCIL